MTPKEKQKAINALKKSAPIMAVTQEEFADYIQTLNKIMDWLEQETVSRESYEHEYFLRKEFELKIDELQRQLEEQTMKVDKIRAEIEQLPVSLEYPDIEYIYNVTKKQLLEIIDKYKAESEKNPNKSEIPTGSATKNDLALIHTEGLDEEIRCAMCTNSMKSDRGCDGSCVVNKDMYKAVMDAIEKRIQPTNKNGLVFDCVSRQVVFETIDDCNSDGLKGIFCSYDDGERFKEYIKKLPSVTPTQKWIPVSERYPKIEDKYKRFLVTDNKGRVSIQEFLMSLDEEPQPYFSGMVDVIAWMPLPEPYKAESEEI